jgi:hypothetical protein
VLQEDKLFYFKSAEQPKPIAFIPLDQAVVRVCSENNGKDYCFEIVTKHRVYQLVAKSHTDMTDWMKILSVHTILHAENELINQAEEMVAKATLDQYIREEQPFGEEKENAYDGPDPDNNNGSKSAL